MTRNKLQTPAVAQMIFVDIADIVSESTDISFKFVPRTLNNMAQNIAKDVFNY
ncbi:conserved hypothetical protein [Ricinus communis]|uniref:RNase H type-1 domain-containing protein n=1 Tax=Ricinus communis TaxID=3988 RepID=B9SDR5_RICCO|nr:conserved hypothetical protein [Ricinus communis]